VRFDRDVDFEFPRRLVCFRPMEGSIVIRRQMRQDERVAVQTRAAALELCLEPLIEAEVAAVEASIAAMLGGFRQMRQEGENVVRTVEITRAVLREFPAWAITKACLRLARRETNLDPRYAPNDAQIADEVRSILKPYREAFAQASALLKAAVEESVRRRDVGIPTSTKSLPAPLAGERAERLKADLEERKQRRLEQQP